MEMRIERVVLETDRHMIVGDIHLPREGYRSRLSDFLNRSDDQFVSMARVEVSSLNGDGKTEERDFLAVSRAHVSLAYPLNEES
jgi:hypothetical protein